MKVDSVSNLTLSQGISQRSTIGKSGPSMITRTDNTPNAGTAHSGPASVKLAGSVSSDRNSAAIHGDLSNAERAYFAKLFPDASAQINSHSTTYSPGGTQSQVELGQIINRKM